MSEKGDLGFSPTVRWQGPATNKKREPMTGEQFNAQRQQSADKQAAADSDLVSVLTNAGVPKLAAQAIAQEIQELKNQLSILRGLPPFMKNVEQRG